MPVTQVVADWKSLGEMKNGLLSRIFSKFADAIARDLELAPDVIEARKIVIEITAKPVRDTDTQELDSVDVQIAVGHKMPKRALTARMMVKNNGRQRSFVFNEDFPDEPDQQPLPFTDQEGEAE
ncbi:MAG: hypothetical protein IPJ01_12110 [Micavibrio sp.]|nr:hypothetical protein [Micavibrio sp.]